MRNEFVQGQFIHRIYEASGENESQSAFASEISSKLRESDLNNDSDKNDAVTQGRLQATIIQTGDFCDHKLTRGVLSYKSEELTFTLISDCFHCGILYPPQKF